MSTFSRSCTSLRMRATIHG